VGLTASVLTSTYDAAGDQIKLRISATDGVTPREYDLCVPARGPEGADVADSTIEHALRNACKFWHRDSAAPAPAAPKLLAIVGKTRVEP